MRIRELFTVPEGKKVTEKLFGRVLLSSICSILLCMVCLISTTWAWFTVSVENKENVIQIAAPEVKLTADGQPLTAGTQLSAGEHKIGIEHANELDDLRQKSTLYVTLSLDGNTCVYTMLGGQHPHQTEVTVIAEKSSNFSWTVSWFEPVNAKLLTDNTVDVTAEKSTHPTEATTAPATTESTSVSEETTLPPTAGAADTGQITEPVKT